MKRDCDFEIIHVVRTGMGLVWFGVLLALLLPARAYAEKPRVGMRMELMSIRNRSAGPLPVRIKLEYNQPQILQGDLELSIYDALDHPASEDLMATVRHTDIVLASGDYEFNMLLPPLPLGSMQNWAVQAWFVTEEERIPLSSIPDRMDPAEPFDLLTTSPGERGTLLCSCSADPIAIKASANRLFLESALSLDNYNPLYQQLEARKDSPATQLPGSRQIEMQGRTLIHFAGQWAAGNLPQDPLAYCAFDVVLLSDGALARLSIEQLAGLKRWLQAGGSVCILPDAPMQKMHLEFLRSVFEQGLENPADLTLDSDGRLLVISDMNDPVIISHLGLGRAVLLPAMDELASRLNREELGRIVAFLWKVRRDQPVWRGEFWEKASLLDLLKLRGVEGKQDETGIYFEDENHRYWGGYEKDGRYYINEIELRRRHNIDDRFNPRMEPLLTMAEQALLPEDVQMVPAWVIGLILCGYVLAIGPVDYVLLGWLKLRKYTWVLFPVVTALFTGLTVAVANAYMGSDDTGGRLIITDLVDEGVPVRQTILQTFFYGSETDLTTGQSAQFLVQAGDRYRRSYGANSYGQSVENHSPLSYSGHFPQSYSAAHRVHQWSPVTLRSLSLEPKDADVPRIDWNDSSLVTSRAGNERLQTLLQREATRLGSNLSAAILHRGTTTFSLGRFNGHSNQPVEDPYYQEYYARQHSDHHSVIQQFLDNIPTMKVAAQDLFGVVSQLSPEGSGSLEDLAFLDPADERQWALIIIVRKGEDFRVYRKLYIDGESTP